MSRHLNIRILLIFSFAGLCVSCVGRDTPSIKSPDPDRLVPAIKTDVSKGDRNAIPYMVKDLESDDPAVRMYAIDGLRRMTGQDFGYVYYAAPEDRKPALERWRLWLELQPAFTPEQ